MRTLSRRDVLQRCAAAGVLLGTSLSGTRLVEAVLSAEQGAKAPTPSNALGPFYRRGAPTSTMRAAGDPGMPLMISGAVYDTTGQIRTDATIEVWQADHHGHYDIEGYKYRALMSPDAKGGYKVETVMPGHYPQRVAQHVHYMVKAPGCTPLVTQLYFATDPVFRGDPDHTFSVDPLVQSRELVRPVLIGGDPGEPVAQVTFELCLERA